MKESFIKCSRNIYNKYGQYYIIDRNFKKPYKNIVNIKGKPKMDNILYGTNMVSVIQLIRIKKTQSIWNSQIWKAQSEQYFAWNTIRIQPLLYSSLFILYNHNNLQNNKL